MEIDNQATYVENFEKCPLPPLTDSWIRAWVKRTQGGFCARQEGMGFIEGNSTVEMD